MVFESAKKNSLEFKKQNILFSVLQEEDSVIDAHQKITNVKSKR